MSDYLVIVESPAKAKTIKKYLGSKYSVMASMGHVRDLPKSQIGVDVENDFAPKYITIKGKSDLIKKLKKEAKESKGIFLATDPDREGEAISWHLLNALDIDHSKAKRVVFNEITKTAVQNAIKSPREIDQNLVDAQQARRVLDRIVGYKLSPLLWRKIRKGLSAGRVQSVAVRILCDRENEIKAFITKEYWSIAASLLKNGAKAVFKAMFHGDTKKKIEIENEAQATAILNELQGAEFVVGNVKKGQKKRQPSAPFITSTLQQEASRKLGFAGQRTMMAAQTLYEGVDVEGNGTVGLITYMRTDSTRIAFEAQEQAKEYIAGKWGASYLPSSPRIYKNKRNAQDAHEAIRPTNVFLDPEKVKASLKPDQYKVYKLVWDRFLASQMANAEMDTVNVDINAGKYIFKASGSVLKFAGFMVLYIEGVDTQDEEKEQNLPELEQGEKLYCKDIEPKQHFTQPPPRYTEATLIKALEESGIGRPSTYAPIITTIVGRGYVEREKRTLFPTELGMLVTDMMKEYFKDIVDLDFTAHMEEELDSVEEGSRRWVDIIRKFYGPFDTVLQNADKVLPHLEIKPKETEIPCEKCGKMMVIREGRFGKFLACPGFPACRNTKQIVEEENAEGVKSIKVVETEPVVLQESDVACEKCGKMMVIREGKNGKFLACPGYPKCKNTKAILEDAGVPCPKCGGTLKLRKLPRGKMNFSCEGCDFTSWDKPTAQKCAKCGSVMVEKVYKGNTSLKCSNAKCETNKKAKK